MLIGDQAGKVSSNALRDGMPVVVLLLVMANPLTPAQASAACGDDVTPTNSTCGEESESSDPGSARSGLSPQSTAGNPISLLTGNKHQAEQDFAIPDGELGLRRFYNSVNVDWNVGIGNGWHHTYTVSLHDAGNGARDIVQSDGRRLHFEPAGVDEAGQPVLRGGSAEQGYLLVDGETHVWHLPDGRALHFRGNFLVRIEWPDQRALRLFYRAERLATVTDEVGRELAFRYSEGQRGLEGYEQTRFTEQSGQLATVTLPDGRVIGFDYDEKRNLSRVRYPDGSTREYHYENTVWPHHLTGLSDRRGTRFATWRYDAEGRAITSERAGGVERVSIVHPDPKEAASGAQVETRVTNSLGEESVFGWRRPSPDADPQLLASSGAGCATCPPTGVDYTYDTEGRLESATRTGAGNAVGLGRIDYRYDEAGRLVERLRTTPDGESTRLEGFEYEGDALMPRRTLRPSVNPEAERVSEIERDDNGRPVRLTERGYAPRLLDATRADAVDPASNPASNPADDPVAGSSVRYEPIEHSTTLRYDEGGRLIAIDGPRTDVEDITRLRWNAASQLEQIQSAGLPAIDITAVDTLGRTTQYTSGVLGEAPVDIAYNDASQIVSLAHRGRVLRLTYDADGRLARYTDADGRQTTLDYDDAGQLVSIRDAEGRLTRLDRDSEGRVTEQLREGLGGELISSLRTLHDAQGRVESITRESSFGSNPVQQSLDYAYDEENRPVTLTDQSTGDALTLRYNPFGALAAIVEPGNVSSEYTHDAAGQQIAFTDARGNRTQHLKDDAGRVVALISPDTGITRYRYDAAGNRTEKRAADGTVTTYRWDAANRLVTKMSPDGETTYAYDPRNGRLSQTTNASGSERFDYDALAQLTAHTREIDGRTFVTAYNYDAAGRVREKTLPDGQVLNHHYHESGPDVGTLRAITRASLFGLQQETVLAEIDSFAADGASGYLSHNGIRTQRKHAPDGRVESIEISQTLTLDYTYDDAGRIIGIDENGIGKRFDYTQGRLSAARGPNGTWHYDYDAVGNRTASAFTDADGTMQEGQAHRYATPGEGNRLLESTDALSGHSERHAYTDTGASLTRPGAQAQATLRYEYNADQRPVRVYRDETLLAAYAYNSFGERIRKVVYNGSNTRVTYFLYDGHQLTAEIDGGTGSANASTNAGGGDAPLHYRHTVFVEGAPLAYLIGKRIHAVHTDHLGTPQALSDDDGKSVWTARYDPFGKAEITHATIAFPHRLPGQYEDTETGTHYNYYRDYDPATGRYLTSDPIGLQGGVNTYAYANADPLGLSDRLGLSTDDETDTRDGPTNPGNDVSDQSFIDRLEIALNGTLDHLVSTGEDAAAGLINDLLQPESLAMMAATSLALAGVQAVPGLNAVVDGALALYIYWNFGRAGVRLAGALLDLVVGIFDSETSCDLEALGANLGAAIVGLGATAFELLGSRGGLLDRFGGNQQSNGIVSGSSSGVVGRSEHAFNPRFWNRERNFQGNRVLQRDDLIDPNRLDDRGRTNLERMQQGVAPIGPDGNSVNLHHLTQRADGGIAEVTQTMHQQNSATLHINPNSVPSGIDRAEFERWKRAYWRSRANDFDPDFD